MYSVLNSSEELTVNPPHGAAGVASAENPQACNQSSLGDFFRKLGPGLVTGASDDDPAGIGTYSMAGAKFGYSTLWTALLTYPLMACIQFICAKIGMVGGCGLAGLIRRHYPRPLLFAAVGTLVVANTINAAADLAAIAAGIELIIPIPKTWLIAPLGLLILAVQVWGSYEMIANTFKWLALVVLTYIASAFFAKPDWHQVLQGTLIPDVHWNQDYFAMLVAILGTTISPYLFFWQANHEVEEEIAEGRTSRSQRRGATTDEVRFAFWDVNVGMLLSNGVMYFIILSTAATLHYQGKTDIQTAADAAEGLRPIAGDWAFALMAAGLIGGGVLAVPILTGSSAYAIAEALGWKCGLNEKPHRAKEFYIAMTLVTLLALGFDYAGFDMIKALFWTSVLNGLLAPPLLVLILFMANNPEIMGDHKIGWVANLLGWTTTVLMFIAAIGLFFSWGA